MDLDKIYASGIPLAEKRRLAQLAVSSHTVSKGVDGVVHECSDDELKLQYEQLLDLCKTYKLGDRCESRPSVGDLTSHLTMHQFGDLAKRIAQAARGRHAKAHYRSDLISLVTDTLNSIAGQSALAASSSATSSEPAASHSNAECQMFEIYSNTGSEAEEDFLPGLYPSTHLIL